MKFLHKLQNKRLTKMLAAARRRAGLTPQELAEKVSVRQNFVAKYQDGKAPSRRR